MSASRRTDALLLLGMAAGVALAGLGLVGDGPAPSRPFPEGAVAVVGGRAVSRAAFESAVALVERDRDRPCSDEEKARILQRLVEEELLLQQALALGLARSDRKLRADLVAAMVDAATAQAPGVDPSPDELRAFFEENRGLFASPPALRVEQVFVSTAGRDEAAAEALARQALRRLRAGEPLAAVRRELGDPPSVEIPASLQPASRLRDYVGPSAAGAALALREGEVSEALRGADGWRVLVVLERREGPPAGFEDRRGQVLAEFRRRRGEDALHDYLAGLRRQSEVALAPGFAEPSP